MMNKRITIVFDEDQHAKLKALADECNLKLATWVRYSILKMEHPKPPVSKINQQTYIELNRIGTNLNQLTKNLNTGIINVDLSATISELKTQIDNLQIIIVND